MLVVEELDRLIVACFDVVVIFVLILEPLADVPLVMGRVVRFLCLLE